MCGRQRCSLDPAACTLAASSLVEGNVTDRWIDREAFRPSDNVSPGFSTPVVRVDDEDSSNLMLHTMRWGLVPSFTSSDAKPNFWRMFNARSEGVAQSPVFRRLLPHKRCIVLTQGFFEWATENKAKQPYYVHLKGEQAFCFAGLYDSWTNAEGVKMFTYTILTTNSSKRLQWLHDRMPVLLRTKEACAEWLHKPQESIARLMQPYNGDDLVWFPVTKAINRAGYSGSDCCKPLTKPSMASFFERPTGKTSTMPSAAEVHTATQGDTATQQTGKADSAPAGDADRAEAINTDTLPRDDKAPVSPSRRHRQDGAPSVSASDDDSKQGSGSVGLRSHTEHSGHKRAVPSKVKHSPAKKAKHGELPGKTKQPSMLSFFKKEGA